MIDRLIRLLKQDCIDLCKICESDECPNRITDEDVPKLILELEQIKKSSFGIRNLHIQLCHDFMKLGKKAIDDDIGLKFWDFPEVKEIRTVMDYIEKKYTELKT